MQICKNKIIYSILLAVMISGCDKTLAQKEKENSSVLSNSSLAGVFNPWGVLVGPSAPDPLGAIDILQQQLLSPENKAMLALDYGAKYIRTNITKDEWDTKRTGFFYTYGYFTNKGLSVLLNITWHEPTLSGGKYVAAPFPYDANNPNSPYYKYVQAVIDSLTSNGRTPPAVVVVENEETNKNYHVIDDTKDYDKYILMLKAVTTICHAKGIKVTNGGLTLRGLTYTAWDWLKNVKGKTADAQTFALNSMPPSSYYALYPPRPANIKSAGIQNINDQIAMVKYYINSYKTLPLDYINFHWYEPAIVRGWVDSDNGGSAWSLGINKNDTSAGAMDNVLNYLTASVKPKKVISNEIGQFTQSDCLTRKMMKKIASRPYNAFEIASWFDGDGDGEYEARAMHNTFLLSPVYTMRGSGITFRRLIKDPAAFPSCTPVQ